MKVAVILASICLVALVSGAPSTSPAYEAEIKSSTYPSEDASSESSVGSTAEPVGSTTESVRSTTESVRSTTESVDPTTEFLGSTTSLPVDVSSDRTALLKPKPTSTTEKPKEDEKVIVTTEFFDSTYLSYTSEHDIVSLVIPINALNFDESDDDDDESATIFFVEADIKDGKKDYKGLYVYDRKNAKLLLANGRDAASSINDKSKDAFFAADDGIYSYDVASNSAVKYGTFNKSTFAIAKPNGTDAIYVLTDDKDLYKITNEGKDAVKIDAVKNAEAIVIDSKNNLYFYTAGNAPRIYDGETVRDIAGLPSNPSYVALLRPSFISQEGTIIAVINDKAYMLDANATSQLTQFELEAFPTAYGMEGGLIHYYAYDKKIYEYNFLDMLFGGFIEGLKNFVDDKMDDIQRYASKPRSAFNKR